MDEPRHTEAWKFTHKFHRTSAHWAGCPERKSKIVTRLETEKATNDITKRETKIVTSLETKR